MHYSRPPTITQTTTKHRPAWAALVVLYIVLLAVRDDGTVGSVVSPFILLTHLISKFFGPGLSSMWRRRCMPAEFGTEDAIVHVKYPPLEKAPGHDCPAIPRCVTWSVTHHVCGRGVILARLIL